MGNFNSEVKKYWKIYFRKIQCFCKNLKKAPVAVSIDIARKTLTYLKC